MSYYAVIVLQTKLYPGRWDGFGKDNPEHLIPGKRCQLRHPRSVPHHRPSVNDRQLAAGVWTVDGPECDRVSRHHAQSQHDSRVWDVLQRWTGQRSHDWHWAIEYHLASSIFLQNLLILGIIITDVVVLKVENYPVWKTNMQQKSSVAYCYNKNDNCVSCLMW